MKPIIHPNWDRPPTGMTDGFSLEITARDAAALVEVADRIPAETPVAVAFLPGEKMEDRVRAARTVRELGFEPMPHLSARRIGSEAALEEYLAAVVAQAGVRRCFVVAGDPPVPEGPFADSSAIIATGVFERAGITALGVGGHPEGHPNMNAEEGLAVLGRKCTEIERRGMAPLIVTQFGFDAGAVLRWLRDLRGYGIDVPVRLGVPGPASIKTLLRFAALCGVGASAAVLRKYGISLGTLIGSAGPDRFVDKLAAGLTPEHGPVRLHFYPFGGLDKTVAWIRRYERSGQLPETAAT